MIVLRLMCFCCEKARRPIRDGDFAVLCNWYFSASADRRFVWCQFVADVKENLGEGGGGGGCGTFCHYGTFYHLSDKTCNDVCTFCH